MGLIEHTHEGKDARWWAENAAHWYGQFNEQTDKLRTALRELDELIDQHRGAVDVLREIASDECMIVRMEDGPYIDTGRPQRLAQDLLNRLGGR